MKENNLIECNKKRMLDFYIWFILFTVVDIIIITLGDRQPGQGFAEYAAWMTVGLAGLVGGFFAMLIFIGWAGA